MGKLEDINRNDEDMESLDRAADKRKDYSQGHDGIYDIKKLVAERDELDRLLQDALARNAKLEEIDNRMFQLLTYVGNKGTCKGCGDEIWWVTHLRGAKTPYTRAGLNHFIDCSNAKDFRK